LAITSPNKAQITPNPQGIITPQSEQSTLFGLWGFSLADRQVSTTRLGFFVLFNPNAKTTSIMLPDAGSPLVKTKTTSAHHHRSLRPSQDCGFWLFFTPMPRRTCLQILMTH